MQDQQLKMCNPVSIELIYFFIGPGFAYRPTDTFALVHNLF